MLSFDIDRCRRNVQAADTADLLDRVTVYRAELEPGAIPIIELELSKRGFAAEAIAQHAMAGTEGLLRAEKGFVRKCSFCPRPAVAEDRGWHRLWGVLPVFPRTFRRCVEHRGGN